MRDNSLLAVLSTTYIRNLQLCQELSSSTLAQNKITLLYLVINCMTIHEGVMYNINQAVITTDRPITIMLMNS